MSDRSKGALENMSHISVHVYLTLSLHQACLCMFVCLYVCPLLNVALCIPFLDNALHSQKRQSVGI